MYNKKLIGKILSSILAAGLLGNGSIVMAANSGISSNTIKLNNFDHYIGDNNTALNNVVKIDSDLACGIIGGYTKDGESKNNSVYINSGEINGYIYGGYSETGSSEGNIVYINGGTIKSNVRGGSVGEGYVSDNYVKINSGDFTTNTVEISGGSSIQSSVINYNTVEINGGSFGVLTTIYGGSSNNSNISNNTVKIMGGTFSGANWNATGNRYDGSTIIAGGYSDGGIVQGNRVEISGGDFEGRNDVFAGNSGNAQTGTVIDNTILLSGNVDLTQVNLYGRNSDAAYYENNNLIINGWSGSVNSLHYFDNIEFENIAAQDTVIEIKNNNDVLTGTGTTDISKSNIQINSLSKAIDVDVNDKLTITMSGLEEGKDIQESLVSLGPDGIRQGVATSIVGDISVDSSQNNANDKITVTVTEKRAQKQTAITTESQAAATAFINQGNELISESLNVLHDGEYGITTFARVNGNNSKYNTGSYVDINGWNSIVGVADSKKIGDSKVNYAAFFENGSGNYNTYNDFNGMAFRGDGNVVYNGGGMAIRCDGANGVYAEASLRAGTAKNELSDVLSDTNGNRYGYETENAYYGGHIGIGKIVKLDNDKAWDFYGKYFHVHHEGDSVNIGGDEFKFDSVDSDKLRIGARFNESQGEKLRSYYGLAWEYEFSGDVGGTAAGHAMYTPSLEGSTVIAEMGFRYTPGNKSPWYFDANIKGYVGQQEGISGSVQANYTF